MQEMTIFHVCIQNRLVKVAFKDFDHSILWCLREALDSNKALIRNVWGQTDPSLPTLTLCASSVSVMRINLIEVRNLTC